MKNLSKIETNKNTKSAAKKISFEEQINEVQIKNREKVYFENVFKDLCALEKEPSSDENSNLIDRKEVPFFVRHSHCLGGGIYI